MRSPSKDKIRDATDVYRQAIDERLGESCRLYESYRLAKRKWEKKAKRGERGRVSEGGRWPSLTLRVGVPHAY